MRIEIIFWYFCKFTCTVTKWTLGI